ncbi:non-structural maintenance of chromosomes element 3 homolog [Hylaeus volcanicus]|uniref:non-structural maintenance of chromosomes element 3 homolog n=1 Tax=Hylaeus volcanicus TaxID=313075 RepID=UPI0023B7BA6C|nr:non-structural maintenance of chromosomes element 3 homolog [Hylaeus volcanicus]
MTRSRGKFLSQQSVRASSGNVTILSQPVPSTSRRDRGSPESPPNRVTTQEENQLVGSLIKHLFALDKKKQIVNKARLIKNVFGGQGKQFHQLMSKAKHILSNIYGYQLMEIESGKYILVNEIKNPHLQPSKLEASKQVLLFLVLSHIFMSDEFCTKETLWEFLTNMGIKSDNSHHYYFGDVAQSIEVFVQQRYLEKVAVDKDDPTKIEYKWGMRAEYEVTRRSCLEFVSQIYSRRRIESWPAQYKAVIAHEKTKNCE